MGRFSGVQSAYQRNFLVSIGIKQVRGEYKRIAVPPIKNSKWLSKTLQQLAGSGSLVYVWDSHVFDSYLLITILPPNAGDIRFSNLGCSFLYRPRIHTLFHQPERGTSARHSESLSEVLVNIMYVVAMVIAIVLFQNLGCQFLRAWRFGKRLTLETAL